VALAATALVTSLSVNDALSVLACVPVLIAIGYWLVYRRKLEEGEPEMVERDAEALVLISAHRRTAAGSGSG
jgi:hypothetical protein